MKVLIRIRQHILVVLITALIIITAIGLSFVIYDYYFSNNIVITVQNIDQNVHRFCTEEALVCPDGSSVYRVGDECVFSPCSVRTTDNRDGGLDTIDTIDTIATYSGVLVFEKNQLFLSMDDPNHYKMPITLMSAEPGYDLIGGLVTVTGTFHEGNRLYVSHIYLKD
jgi:hypothetical protein